ncbi:PREDICTED: polyadenylate-binding protein 2-like [Lupinus angustifolius]|uniref:polyadenylate-binding protein 2-like n=1 Tax=Lupinus angustifolius TaxID=3871 RepID=UPI00092F510B|nr:PREDICTED: polyadenylate-binding protein 2-like [Lupinus angustifolius]
MSCGCSINLLICLCSLMLLMVQNLDKGLHYTQLYELCSNFGNIISCKIAKEPSGKSKGYGYVQFENEESAQNTIDNLNRKRIKGKQVSVSHFVPKEDRETVFSIDTSKVTELYVKNLSKWLTEVELESVFGEYGTIANAIVMRNADGSSKCFGFVHFENPDSAAKALKALNGMKFDGKKLYVRKAMDKSERELEMKNAFDRVMQEIAEKKDYVNLYIKNLPYSITDEKLKEMFSQFGRITSYRVLRDHHGISRGYGFVEFSTPEEANQVVSICAMNGKIISGRRLGVSLAQKKELGRSNLQAQFSQMRPVTMAPPASEAPHIPLNPPRAPAAEPQFLSGLATPGYIPEVGFGYQLTEMRTGGAPVPNFFIPLVQPGPHDPLSGGGQGSDYFCFVFQVLSRSLDNWLSSIHNTQDAPWPAVAGGMPHVPYDMGGLPIGDALGQPMATQSMSTALANASAERQRAMLGQALYPLVRNLEPDSAEKITGMILEMDEPEVLLHLIVSPDALKEKVAEAMDLLQCHAAPEDQLASLHMN